MKRLLTIIATTLTCNYGHAQITITGADMPVAHDTFAYSTVQPAGVTINPGDSGANFSWNYPLVGTSQGMDIFKTAAEVSPLLSFTLPPGLYGYRVADSIPGLGILMAGITIQNMYTYFQHLAIPSAYVAVAFSASINSIPLGTTYTDPDVWYTFPLAYGHTDSFNYKLPINIPTIGGITQAGYRKTVVDGWGTISTPYYTTPVNCIRVRSEINEIDSIDFSGTSFGLPRNSVEYKWLVNGDHFPALWVTSSVIGGNEVITNIRYRDHIVDKTVVPNTGNADANVSAYPNPSLNGIYTLSIPSGWGNFHVDVFDMRSAMIASQDNNSVINLQSLPAGNYVARVISGTNLAFVPLVK